MVVSTKRSLLLLAFVVLFGILQRFSILEDASTLIRKEESTKHSPCWSIGSAPNVTIFPRHFMEQGAGLEFLPNYRKNMDPSKKPTTKPRVRFVIYNLTSQCRPIYYHILKNGGTAMNRGVAQEYRHRVEAYYSALNAELGNDLFHNRTHAIMSTAYDSPEQFPIFTFLRCPVERFLSALYQVLELGRLNACRISATRERYDSDILIDCILNKIKEKETYLDEHLQPQAYQLYTGTMGLDLPMTVFHMKFLTTPFGAPTQTRVRKDNIRGFNLSLSVLNERMIQDICAIYQVDVRLLEQVKVTPTICAARGK